MSRFTDQRDSPNWSKLHTMSAEVIYVVYKLKCLSVFGLRQDWVFTVWHIHLCTAFTNNGQSVLTPGPSGVTHS